MQYLPLNAETITLNLFAHFQRRQPVTQCWRKIDGTWQIQDIAFTDDWSEADYAALVATLQHTAEAGGLVLGAFDNRQLKGFASVEPALLGQHQEYLDLNNLHVSQDCRGKGIGKALFRLAQGWAKEHGAKKLYISAHSAVESQAFYRAMGCVDALEVQQAHAAREPFDCQLECDV